MNPKNLDQMTVDELVEHFAGICVEQSEALDHDAFDKYNDLYDQMDAVDRELRSRGDAARLTLMRLYDFPNMQVRLKAAIRTLGVAPEAARELIQEISDSGWPPQAMHAGMTLFNLERGIFVPD